MPSDNVQPNLMSIMTRSFEWIGRRYPGDKGPLKQLRYRLEGSLAIPSVREALEALKEHGSIESPCPDDPIFIFSAGWRSGSTLIQRLIVSSGDVLLWGEPFGPASPCRYMTEQIRRIPQSLRSDRFIPDQVTRDELSASFIANLYPCPGSVLDAHIQFWDALLAKPARQRGFGRWGFKDVRLEVNEADYLRWLYPNAKFIFMYRNPLDAYSSYRSGIEQPWFDRWPESPIYGATDFGNHWKRLVDGFLERSNESGALVLKYEDLKTTTNTINRLEEFLGLKIDRSILESRVGASSSYYKANRLEIQALEKAVSPTALKLGYSIARR